MAHPPVEPDSKPLAVASSPRRRGMLLGTGVAAVAGVAAALASRTLQLPAPEPVTLAKQDKDAEGYRLSPHVLRYYETARV